MKRLLISGGAEVYNLCIPIKNAPTVAKKIVYVFVSENNVPTVVPLLQYGVLCLKPEFIADFLIKDPSPDPFDYLVQVGEGIVHAAVATDSADITLSQDSSHQSAYSLQSTPATSTQPDSLTPVSFSFSPQSDSSFSLPPQPTTANSAKSRLVFDSTDTSGTNHVNNVASCSTTLPVSVAVSGTTAGGSKTGTHSVSESKTGTDGVSKSTAETGICNDTHSHTEQQCNHISPSCSDNINGTHKQKSCGIAVALVQAKLKLSKLIEKSKYSPKKAVKPKPDGTECSLNSTPVKLSVSETASHSQGGHGEELSSDSKHVADCDKFTDNSQSAGDFLHFQCQTSVNSTQKKDMNSTVKDDQCSVLTDQSAGDFASANSDDCDRERRRNIFDAFHAQSSYMTSQSDNTGLSSRPSQQANKATDIDIGKKTTGTYVVKATNAPVNRYKAQHSSQVTAAVPITKYMVKRNGDIDGAVQSTSTQVNGNLSTALHTHRNTAAMRNKNENATKSADVEGSRHAGKRRIIHRTRSHEITDEPTTDMVVECEEPGVMELKRRKISETECLTSTFLGNLNEHEEFDEGDPMPDIAAEFIRIFVEDESYLTALTELNERINCKHYPHSHTLSLIMRNVLLKSVDLLEVNMAGNVLSKILQLHPPITPALQTVYLAALTEDPTQSKTQIGEEWTFIKDTVYGCLSEDTVERRNCAFLFKFLIRMLQYNVQHFMYASLGETTFRHLLVRIMWPPAYHVVFNSRCKELMHLLQDVINAYISNKEDREYLVEILGEVVWLAAMVTETCRVHDNTTHMDEIKSLHTDKTLPFIIELGKAINYITFGGCHKELLQYVLMHVQLPWLQAGVCQQLLDTYDAYLLNEPLYDNRPLDLTLIFSHYIYLLPQIQIHIVPKNEDHERQSQSASRRKQQEMKKVQKRNGKGETPLQVACIKNDLAAVKKLLKVPGVDVNTADNNGWTPLHEAASHGHVECVRELLNFIPAKTIDNFFNKDSPTRSRVDVTIAGSGGITPLHDAVLNNQVEISRLLLEHGGHKLLSAKTAEGNTALDLANDEEMYSTLVEFLPIRKQLSDSQSSQGSESFDSQNEVRRCIPNDDLYSAVLCDSKGERVVYDTSLLLQYIRLITHLIHQYILTRKHLKSLVYSSPVQSQPNCAAVSHTNCVQTNRQAMASHTCCHNNEASCSGSSKENEKPSTIPSGLDYKSMSKEERRHCKKEVKLLKEMKSFVDLFSSHLTCLCSARDSAIIEEELQDLLILAHTVEN